MNTVHDQYESLIASIQEKKRLINKTYLPDPFPTVHPKGSYCVIAAASMKEKREAGSTAGVEGTQGGLGSRGKCMVQSECKQEAITGTNPLYGSLCSSRKEVSFQLLAWALYRRTGGTALSMALGVG